MATNDRVTSLAKLVYDDGELFVPSDKEQQVVSETVDLFRQTAQARDRNFQYFDGLNLYDYINDSVLRFNTNVDERDNIEDWQAGINVPMTRNKVLAILGKVLQVLPMAQFKGRNDEDVQKGVILTDLYEYVEELDDYEEFMSHILLEAIVKGTAIGYEDIEYQEKTYRDVKGIGDDITVNEKKEKNTKLYASIVPLEEFYPSSVSLRKVKDMPYCFWRQTMPYSKFLEQFGHYRKSQLVSDKRTYADAEERPYYYDYIDESVPDGSVEVIRMYDKMHDEYIIIANGIWLNPIKVDEQDVISPLPWNHKDLPFWEIKFDYFGDFFYGKSLPDRIKSMQDVLNVLTNMLLDQSFLSIFPPLLTNGFDSVEDDYIRPGRRTPVDTQGLPINQAFQVLETPTPSGWHQYILDYTRTIIEESSLDKVSQGIAGQGDRTTAQEIRVAASGVEAMLQLFARMVNYGVKRKALLKVSNILQFGLNKEAPIARRVLGENAPQMMNKAFMTIKKDGAVLTKGKRGTKLIEVYSKKGDIPSRDSIRARAMLAQADSQQETEIVAIPANYLRNYQFDVELVPNPKTEASREIEMGLQLEKVRVYMSFFPRHVNVQELATETAQKMGDDPTKVLRSEVFNPAPEGPETDQGLSLNPQGNEANNIARSARGGEGNIAEMQQLQAALTQ